MTFGLVVLLVVLVVGPIATTMLILMWGMALLFNALFDPDVKIRVRVLGDNKVVGITESEAADPFSVYEVIRIYLAPCLAVEIRRRLFDAVDALEEEAVEPSKMCSDEEWARRVTRAHENIARMMAPK